MPRVGISRHLLLLLSISATLLIVWSFAVPIFEAPDEETHWQYARYVHDHWRIPLYGPAMWEGNQPPLYYWIIAPTARSFVLPLPERFVDVSGNFIFPCAPRFYNDCISDFRKYWPLRSARILTALLSVVTVLFTYLTAYEATGSCLTGILAGSLTALLPQFTFRGMNLSNDAMVATTSAIATYFLVLLIRRDFSWSNGCFASLSVAAAILSKLNALIFLPMLLFVLISGPSSWKVKFKHTSVLLITFIFILPWLIRNRILYGDIFASEAMLTAVPIFIDKKSIMSPYFRHFFPEQFAKSFVGVFGGMNVYMSDWVYGIFAITAVVALIGFAMAVVRRVIDLRLAVILCALPLLATAEAVWLNLTVSQPQGRYLFPALSAVMIVTAIGLERLPKWNPQLSYLAIALFGAINLYALFGIEVRTYWLPYSGSRVALSENAGVPWTFMTSPAGPIVPGGRFGQTFIANRANLAAVEIEVATYGKRIPSGFVKIHLRHSPEENDDIAMATIPAYNLTDNGFARLTFPPIADSNGKSYYVFLEAEALPKGYPITVWTSRGKGDVYPQGQFFLDGRPTAYDTSFQAFSAIACPTCGQSAMNQSNEGRWHPPF